jgi:hypothetical protein
MASIKGLIGFLCNAEANDKATTKKKTNEAATDKRNKKTPEQKAPVTPGKRVTEKGATNKAAKDNEVRKKGPVAAAAIEDQAAKENAVTGTAKRKATEKGN